MNLLSFSHKYFSGDMLFLCLLPISLKTLNLEIPNQKQPWIYYKAPIQHQIWSSTNWMQPRLEQLDFFLYILPSDRFILAFIKKGDKANKIVDAPAWLCQEFGEWRSGLFDILLRNGSFIEEEKEERKRKIESKIKMQK